MKYLLIIVIILALLVTGGCIRNNQSSSSDFEITNAVAKPQAVLSVYDVDFDVKNTASEKKQITTIGADLYDTNGELSVMVLPAILFYNRKRESIFILPARRISTYLAGL